MRRQVTTAETLCDLCGDRTGVPELLGWMSASPLDFCCRCEEVYRPCESCGSLPTFPDVQVTWAGNCLACWRAAMSLPRGKCSANKTNWDRPEDYYRCECDQLANHPDAHHCPDCDANWGLR